MPPLDSTWLAHSSPNERFLQMIILRIVLLGHGTGGADTGEFSVRLIGALAGLAAALGIDPGESGWGRILDALLLIVAHPVPPPEG